MPRYLIFEGPKCTVPHVGTGAISVNEWVFLAGGVAWKNATMHFISHFPDYIPPPCSLTEMAPLPTLLHTETRDTQTF